MDSEKTFYQVISYNEATGIHMSYSVYEEREDAEKFKKYLENCNTKLQVWINTVAVYFKK